MKKKLSEEQNKKLEILAILMLIAFALVSYFIANIVKNGVSNTDPNNINVFVNGEKITEIDGIPIDINVDRTFTIGDELGEYNTIEIKDKKIRCIDSNCPDKICVNHSYLSKEIDNDMIVCAPHRLVISYQ